MKENIFNNQEAWSSGAILEEMAVSSLTFEIDSQPRCDVVDITSRVAQALTKSGLQAGIVVLFCVGSTGGITTVEYEPGCVQDLDDLFERLAPAHRDYHHEQAWHDGNGYSHVRAALLGPSLTVPFVDGKLRLGTWQQIVSVNFDNRPRTRQIAMQLIGD